MNEHESQNASTDEQDDLDEYHRLIREMTPEKAHMSIIQRRLAEAAQLERYNDLVNQKLPVEEAFAKANGYEWSAENERDEKTDDGEIDASRLNQLIQETSKLGALIGKDVIITQHDRDQFRLVASIVDSLTEPLKLSSDWQRFVDLIHEGDAKGALVSFSTHPGTHVPTWCIDGGSDARVQKIKRVTTRGEANGLQVPTDIFHLYDITCTSEALIGYTRSDAFLKGAGAKEVGEILRKLGHYIKSNQQKVT